MEFNSALEILKKHIKDKKLRFTAERERILKKILEMEDHFDAEELYKKLNKQHKNTVLATVYNTLDLLTECGILNRYRFGSDHYRYEKAIDKPRHHHLICLTCGEINEYISNDLLPIEEKVSKTKNFLIHNSTLQFFGICSKCQKEKLK